MTACIDTVNFCLVSATVKKQDNKLYIGLCSMSTLSSYSSLKTMQKWDNYITKATDFSWKTNKLMQSNNSEDFYFNQILIQKHNARSWLNRSNEKHLQTTWPKHLSPETPTSLMLSSQAALQWLCAWPLTQDVHPGKSAQICQEIKSLSFITLF